MNGFFGCFLFGDLFATALATTEASPTDRNADVVGPGVVGAFGFDEFVLR